MKIELQARGIHLSRSLAGFARLRLRSALATNGRHITHVQVTMSDINGPRGGVDKLCQCQVSMDGGPDIVIRQTSDNMYAAVSSAAARAGRNVARVLGPVNTNSIVTVVAKKPPIKAREAWFGHSK